MEWKIEDKNCWICGKNECITYHHTLPQHWKPKNNIIIPICNKCHDRLNEEDIAGMRQFAFKIEQELGRQLGLWGRLRTCLERYTTMQDKILDSFNKKEEHKKDEKENNT